MLSVYPQTFVANVLQLVGGMVSGIILARWLQPEGRGELAALLFWPHFLTGICALGLNESIAILHARGACDPTRMRSTVFWLSLGTAAIVIPVSVVAIPYCLGDERSEHAWVSQWYAAFFILFSYLSQNVLAIDQAELQFRRFNVLRVLQTSTYPLLLCGLIVWDQVTITNAALASLLSVGITALIRLWIAGTTAFGPPSTVDIKQILGTGLRIHFTNLLVFGVAEADKLFLTVRATNEQLGIYMVALTFASTGLGVISRTFVDVLMPSLSRATDKANKRHMATRAITACLILSTLVNGTLAIVSPLLISWLFGRAFTPAVPVACLLCVGFVAQGLKKTIMYILRSQNEHQVTFWSEAATLITLVVVLPFLYARFALIGAAVAVICAHIAGLLLMGWRFHRLFPASLAGMQSPAVS